MRALTGYLLHPSISIPDDTSSFTAFDISSAQYPPSSIAPPNVEWKEHNCFEPFPEEYVGRFDVVNARFWLCIVNDDVAGRLFENVVKLLSTYSYAKD
jgi:chemotaxis methyl-accepting protein methylase